MKSNFYIFTIFVAVVFVGIRFYLMVEHYTRDRTPSYSPIPDTLGTPVAISTTDMVRIAAAGKLGNMVGDTIRAEADIVRRTGPDTFEVKMMGCIAFCKYKASEAPEAATLKEGDWVTVTGRAYSYIADRLFLKACRFAPRTTALTEGWEIVPKKP